MLLRLAFRNLLRNRRRTLITMSAIALGMALMDLTICIQHGAYQDVIRRGVGTMAGHVVVQDEGYEASGDKEAVVTDSTAVVAALQAVDPDGIVVRRTFMGGLLNSTTGSAAVGVTAIESANSQLIGSLDEYLIDGEWLQADRDIVIGERLMQTLDVDLGDKVVFMTQVGSEMTSRLFRIKGVFRTGAADQDGFLVLITVGAAQAVTEKPDTATQVTLHLDEPSDWPRAVEAARAALDGRTVEVLSWKEALPDVAAFIEVDRRMGQGMISVLGFIIALGVFNTFLMSVLERTREFGVLQSIGMKPGHVARLVMMEGMVLGAISIVIGTLLGAALVWPMKEYGLDFSEEMGEGMTSAGVVMSMVVYAAYNWPRMIVFGIGGFFFTLAAAVWPAWKVSQVSPAEAMRDQQ
jgi:ABC-type lipoprotein release transport system permease subunit